MKKIISITLSLAIMFGFILNTYAVSAEDSYPTLEELLINDEIDLREIDTATPLSLDDVVAARVSIYSSSSGKSSSSISGHSWIVVKNYSSTRKYGTYSASADTSFSMGTWGNQGYNGIWYNIESKYRTNYTSSSTYYLQTVVMASEITTFRNAIDNLNTWTTTKNCSTFAVCAWNNTSGSTITLSAVETPTTLVSKIKAKSGYKTGISDSDFKNASTSVSHY